MSKLFDKAAAAVKKRNYDYAIELFMQELTRDPNNAEARRALRAAELKKFQEAGQSPAAGSAYLKGIGPLVSATIHRLSKNFEKAMLDCEQFLRNAPRNASMLKMLGEMAVQAGHNEAAKAAYEDLLEADRSSEHALRALARIYREEEDIPKALAFYERLKSANPADPEAAKAVRDLAAATASRKVEDRRAEGDGSFRDMVKDKSKTSKLEAAGKRARTTGEIDEAIADLEAQLDGSANDLRYLKEIGGLQVRKKAWSDAVKTYERALEIKKDPQVRDALGDARLKRLDDLAQQLALQAKKGDGEAAKKLKKVKAERIKLAIAEFERRVKSRPTELPLRFQLGQQLMKAKRFDDAIVHLQKATGDVRRGVQARLALGKCFAAKKMVDLAVKEFNRALEQVPSMDEVGKEISYNLALTLEYAGKSEEAAAAYEKIIEVDIGYRDAMKRLEALGAE